MKKKTISVALIIVIITIISKLSGLLRETLLANLYGTSFVTDAFLTSQSIVGIYFGWMSAFETSYVPCYFAIYSHGGEKKQCVNRFTNSLLTMAFVVSIICIIVGYFCSNQLVEFSVPGFSGEVLALTKAFYKQYLFVIPCLLPSAVLLSYIKCNGAYITNNAIQLMLSIGMLLIIVLSVLIGYEWMIWELVLLNYIYLFAIYLCAKKQGYVYRPIIEKSDDLSRLIKLTIPVFFSTMLAEINGYVDKIFSSSLKEGAITSINYAWLLVRTVAYLFISCITTLIYPKLSEKIEAGKIEETRNLYFRSAHVIILICVPFTLMLILYADCIVSMVFMRGNFDEYSLKMTIGPFIGYALMLLPFVFNSLTQNLFYAFSLNKYMTIFSLIGLLVNLIGDYLLVSRFQQMGLALATTLVTCVTSIAYIVVLKIKKGAWGFDELAIIMGKSVVASLPAIFIKLLFEGIGFDNYMNLGYLGFHLAAFFISLVGYIFILAVIFRDDILIALLRKITKKG